MKNKFLYLVLLFFVSGCFSIISQNKEDSLFVNKEFFYNLKLLEFKKAKQNYQQNFREDLKSYYQIFILKDTTYQFPIKPKAIDFLNFGLHTIQFKNDRVNAFKYYLKALEICNSVENKELEKTILRKILDLYLKGNLQNDNDYLNYLNKYKAVCKDNYDLLYYYSFYYQLKSQTEIYNEKVSKNQEIYNKIFVSYDSLVNNYNFNKLLIFYYRDKGNYIIRNNPKIAKKYYEKQLKKCFDDVFYKQIKYIIYCNLSRICSLLNKHKEGLSYLKEAQKYNDNNIKNELALAIYKANHYAKLKQLDSAFFFSEKSRNLIYLYNFQKHNTEVSKIKVELDTEKKEKENLQLKQKNLETEAKRIKNRNFLIGSLLFIVLAGTIAILALKNSKRKQKLLEQEKELETQKNLTLLKEQELATINAMVDGQEKERKRIAEDLHDNLGSVLATLKLHFENLQINTKRKKINQEELFNKTESLIDEAYLKVRSIAHAKNAGVIANQGLLTAVQMMAEKISSAEKIYIEVVHFGLNKRLENSLEITVFRIVQELITNILKHAEATNATINISVYDKNLNIIVEDNGKGFQTKNTSSKDGMGIGSIKTRIAHLNGTFEIDTTIGKGSSVIIDIPIA
ncbi:sensor histidine kinase [Polaribacter batillariae]|uniref:histidine kinase n=1 Tax=Polaribacter batillariae TaxID=2808900 RepID=A0ABX7SX83_9FLAO|nr:sensor histidine kinase [Polaribacter batillariae]QTD37591.1 sensor histidine kinase [Polaribacter batillariae]